MKRFSKILALVLVLAALISAFAIFSAFAEDSTAERTTRYNLDAVTSAPTIKNNSSAGATLEKVTGTYENDVWWKFTNSATGDQYFGATTGSFIVASSDKNTNYMVIDFDMSTDTTLPTTLRFQMIYKNSSNTNTDNGLLDLSITSKNGYFTVTDYTKLGTSYTSVDPIDSIRSWHDVTFVFDYSDIDETTLSLKSITYYIYIDGVLCGSSKVTQGISTNVNEAVAPANILKAYNCRVRCNGGSVNLANLTLSTFDENCEIANLGAEDDTLADHSELAYCLEGKPTTIATISRADETITCSSVEDIQKNIQLGDTVKVYRSIDDAIFVPDNNDGATTLGVTFVDYNGTTIGSTSALVTIAALTELDANTDWAVIDSSNSVTLGNTASDTSGSNDALFDAIASKISSSSLKVVLFDDVAVYYTARILPANDLTVDLNGHKISFNFTADHLFGGRDTCITFLNGEIYFKPAVNKQLIYGGTENTKTIFNNCTINVTDKNHSLIAQAGGYVEFSECTMNLTGSIGSIYGSYGDGTDLTIKDCVINATGSDRKQPVLVVGNYSARSKGYGSTQNKIEITGSTISSTDEGVIKIVEQTNNYDPENAVGLLNDNDIVINITDSTLTTTKGPIFNDAPNWRANSTGTGSVDTDVTVNVVNSTLKASTYLFTRSAVNANYNPSDYTGGVTYDFVMNVDGASKISAGTALANKVHAAGGDGNTEHAFVKVVFNLADGALVDYDAVYTTCTTTAPEAKLPENSVIAYTSLGGDYIRVVTSSYENYTYIKKNSSESVPFSWNVAENDKVNVSLIADNTQGNSIVYQYVWKAKDGSNYTETLAPNFAPTISMSTDGTLALNLFIPQDVYNALGKDNVDINTTYAYDMALNADLSQYGKEGDFAQVKVKGIDPLRAAETVVTVTFTITDGDQILTKPLEVSVLSYAQQVIKSGSAAEKQYAVQLLNYVQAAMTYVGTEEALADAVAVNEVIDASGIEVATGADAVGTAAAGGNETGIESFAMNLSGSINWVLTVKDANINDTFKVSYTRDGVETAVQLKANAKKQIVISLRAYDALNSVTVENATSGGTSTFNLANYHATQDANAQAVLEALAAYAKEAAEYKAALDAVNS